MELINEDDVRVPGQHLEYLGVGLVELHEVGGEFEVVVPSPQTHVSGLLLEFMEEKGLADLARPKQDGYFRPADFLGQFGEDGADYLHGDYFIPLL